MRASKNFTTRDSLGLKAKKIEKGRQIRIGGRAICHLNNGGESRGPEYGGV